MEAKITNEPEAEAMRMVAMFREQNALNRTCECLGSLRREHSGNAHMDASLTAALEYTLRKYDLATREFSTLIAMNRDDLQVMTLVYKTLNDRE